MSAKLAQLILVSFLLAGCSDTSEPTSSAEPESSGWVSLLDSGDYSDWNVLGDANWRTEDDAVVADSSTDPGYLVTRETYSDFELELEFWVTEDANSGIFMRCSDAQEITDTLCYEVNIFDTRPDQTYRTGGIVNVAAPSEFIYTGDQWNSYRITVNGPRMTVILNDREVVDAEDSRLESGPFALQYGSGTVKFRNVRIRRL